MSTRCMQNKYGREQAGVLLMSLIVILAAAGLIMYGPITQNPLYHAFADQRSLLGVPNFWNVFSNLPFLLTGMAGLYKGKDLMMQQGKSEKRIYYTCFFCGVVLTGLGSAYYHYQPDNQGLFWDRLAMAVSFMAFLSIVIGEFINHELGVRMLVPLLLFGLFSVFYWRLTDQLGVGDLRFYAAVQFLPMILVLVVILFWRSSMVRISDVLIIGTGYGIAKICEAFDAQMYQSIGLSGHSFKHLVAAISAAWVLVIFSRYGTGASLQLSH